MFRAASGLLSLFHPPFSISILNPCSAVLSIKKGKSKIEQKNFFSLSFRILMKF